MKSIQTKFIILILSCVLLSSVIIGGGAIYSSKKITERDSALLMNLQCRESTEQFNSLLSRIEQSVKTLAVYALEELDDVGKLKTDSAYMASYTKRLETVAVNAANNTEGSLAVYVRFNPDFAPPTSGLFWSKPTLNGYFRQLTPTDFSRYNPSDADHVGWYYIPVQNGRAMWMRPYLNKNINIRMISYVIPLYKDKETIGVVGMDINFGIFEKLAEKISIYNTGYAFISGESGVVMYHPDYPLETRIESIENTLQPLVHELRNTTSASGLFAYVYKGQQKKVAYRALNNDMRLVITAPVTEIDAVKNRLVIQSIIALLAVSAIAVLLTVFMTRRLVKPLRELTDAAKKIADGDLSISLTQPSKDEVGALADSFQQTVNQLQKYISYINGLAYRDALTGAKNTTAYHEAVSRLEDQMRIGQPQFAIVVMDLNGLKETNDRYGHDFGDMLIMDCCKYISRVFKKSPVYRIGGDEFVVILEGSDYDNYAKLMESFVVGQQEYNSTVNFDNRLSIASGIALYNRDIDLVFANIFKRADDSMYQNKLAMKAKLGNSAS